MVAERAVIPGTLGMAKENEAARDGDGVGEWLAELGVLFLNEQRGFGPQSVRFPATRVVRRK